MGESREEPADANKLIVHVNDSFCQVMSIFVDVGPSKDETLGSLVVEGDIYELYDST